MKISKRDILNAMSMIEYEDVTIGDVIVTSDDILAYIDTQIEALDKRTELNAKLAERRKQEGDELRKRIKATISTNCKTIPQILEALNDPNVTSAMVISRLGQLVRAGEVRKGPLKVDGRNIMAYISTDVD